MPGKLPFPGEIIGYRKNGAPIRLIAGGDLTNDLSGQLETRRASLVSANLEMLKAAAAANEGAGRDLTGDEEKRYQDNKGEIEKLKGRLADLADEQAREQRGAAARADGSTAEVRAGGTVTVTYEPQTYERYSPHSYFADMLRVAMKSGDGDGGPQKAEERLSRHRAEMDVELPRRREQRARAASRMLEEHTEQRLATLPPRMRRREERSVERFLGIGPRTFEQRAINQTQGTGGYFVPPLWLVEEYVAYLRAGRVTANLCHSMPLPPGTNSINLPIITTGTATGVQSSDGTALTSSPGVTDIADSYVNALVRTTAGQEDASMQLLDLSPVAIDQVIFRDLSADYAQNLDGQVLLGSGSSGQMTGLYPQGTITGGSTPGIIVNTVTGTTTSQWVGTNSFYQGMGKLMSQIARLRYANVSAVVTNPAAWYAMATAADGNSRPLVVPSIQGPFNAAAEMDDPNYEGLVGNILGRPWYVDNNIPLTFGGGSTNPSIGKSAGHTAPTDGTGSGNNFTPAIAAAWDDLLLFEGEVRTRVLQEVLSGTLQVRFQIYGYNAFIANRYQGASSQIVSYGNANSGTTAGAALSTGSSGGLVGF